MADRPILFSSAMVRALLDGRKTQTRRILKPQPLMGYAPDVTASKGIRFAKGDRLWVKETWRLDRGGVINDAAGGQEDYVEPAVFYRADFKRPDAYQWRPSIFMPRAHSRLTLTVNDVRVERLQAIRAVDAKAEGWPADNPQLWPFDWFCALWDSINGAGSWGANPWVVAVTFKVERRNIHT